MKRSLLALSVVGALSLGAAQAETVLYGSIRFDYSNTKNTLPTYGVDSEKRSYGTGERASNMRDVGSRIGLKGGEDLGNGIQIVYHLEWGFDGMEGASFGEGFSNRLAYVGLATEFGTFVAGRLDNPFKQTLVDGSVTDDFNSFGQTGSMRAVVSQFAGGIGGAHYSVDLDRPGLYEHSDNIMSVTHLDALGTNYSDMGYALDRVSNAIAYLSPNWNGFSFNVAAILDDDFGGYMNKKHGDIITLNASYEHESGFYGKVGYIQGYTVGSNAIRIDGTMNDSQLTRFNKNRKTRAFGTQLGFRTDQFGVSMSYVDAKLTDMNWNNVDAANQTNWWSENRKDKAKGWDIGASYSFGDNYASTVRIAYGETRYTGDSDRTHFSGNGLSAAYSSSFKPKDKIWAVGFEQKLSERTRVWAEYQQIKQSGNHNSTSALRTADDKVNAGAWSHGFNGKQDTFAIGIRHDF